MYAASAPLHQRFLRSRSLPSCSLGPLLPGHGDAKHQGMAAGEAEGPAAYQVTPFDGADETPLLSTMPVPAPQSPVDAVPYIYFWTPPRQVALRAPEMMVRMQGRVMPATRHSPTSRPLEKRSRSSSNSSGSRRSHSGTAESSWQSATATATTAASASEGRKEKRMSRRGLVGDQRFPTRRQGGPAGGRARKSELAWWHSYFAAGGTLIALACFAALSFLFVNESPPTLPGWFGGAESKAHNHNGDNRPESWGRDSHSDSLAESRNIVRFGTATNVSTAPGRRGATKRRYYNRRPRHHGRLNTTIPHQPLFPIIVPAGTTREVQTEMTPRPGEHRHSVQWDDNVCWTESCLAEGAALRSSLDPSVKPCDDFYAYACNRWSHERPLPRGQAVVSLDLDFMDVFTLDVFNMLGRESHNKLFEKLRLLLEECVAPTEDFFPKLAHEALKSVALVAWPYDNDVDADAVSVSTTVGRMVAAYGFDPVFGLTLTVDPAAETGMRAAYGFFGPDPLLNEGIESGREYGFVRQAYDQLVEAVQEKSLYDPIETDVLLAAVFEESSPISSKALKLRNCSRKLVDQLPYMGEWLFWDKVFVELGLRQGSDASNGSEVLTPDPALFERLSRTNLFKARGSKSKMANYLGFRLLLLLSPFGTGADDTNIPASLAYARHRNYPTSLHDYQACLRLLNRFEPVVAMHRLHGDWTSRISGLVKPDELVQLVTFLRAELPICLQTSSLFFTTSTATVAKALLEFLRGLSWQILNPDFVESTWTFERLSAAYESLNVSNPKQIITFLQSAVQLARDASSDLSAAQWKGGFLSTDATLAYPYKVLEVPLPVFNLQQGALDESVRHLQLARVGPRIYYAIYKALYFTSSNLALENMTWNPLRYFDTAADCLWDQYSSTMLNNKTSPVSNASSGSSPPFANRTRDLDNLFDALALGSALDAYLFYVADKHKRYRFKGSEDLDATQLFFVEYARNLCENRNEKSKGVGKRGSTSEVVDSRSPAWYKVNGPLMNVKEFAKSFSCRPGSFMNPVNKCPLIRKHH